MNEDASRLILGDAVVAAGENGQPVRRRWFRRKRRQINELTTCENCSTPLSGPYCSACGQHAIDYRRSVMRVLADAADSLLNWDAKFLKSLGILLVRPWRLTNEFNSGRRVRYVHPLRLYLLASIVFFLVVKMADFSPSTPADLKPEDRAELDHTLARLSGPDSLFNAEQRARIDGARQKLAEHGALTKSERSDVKKALEEPPGGTPVPKKLRNELKTALARIPPETAATSEAKPLDPAFIGPPPPPKTTSVRGGPLRITFEGDSKQDPKTPFEKWIAARIKSKVGDDGTKTRLFVDTLRSNIPTMMLCCIPLFAVVLKLLYVRQRRFYVEHLVYALHIHTFVYVGVVVITLIGLALAQWSGLARVLVTTALSCVLFVQVFLSIRRVYGQGWFFSSAKFLVGGLIYLFILSFGVGATAFVTLLLP